MHGMTSTGFFREARARFPEMSPALSNKKKMMLLKGDKLNIVYKMVKKRDTCNGYNNR
jgi:hypothetical protein